ncbi:MAG TPA: homoserine dehydrogenase, partial [Candidatus Deferrimicrobiaceae bacterium]|nr:homoserine dehydrogenase [Candidatus Deferrimicrobiaceae bacterium]
MSPQLKEIGVGIIGFGTVGSGTVKLLQDNAELLRRRIGIPIRLVQVADIDLERERDVSLPGEILTNDGFQVVRNQAV